MIRSVFIGLGILVIVVVVAVLSMLLLRQQSKPTASSDTTQSGIFPAGGGVRVPTSSDRKSVPAVDGTAVDVVDFTHNGETVEDVMNPGNYVLAGSLGYCLADGSCPEGAHENDFTVTYSDADGFRIVLLAEPLKDVRRKAEDFLMARLGIGEEEMCKLPYYLGTPYFVNERFSSGNLGFSFCPGAVLLP